MLKMGKDLDKNLQIYISDTKQSQKGSLIELHIELMDTMCTYKPFVLFCDT